LKPLPTADGRIAKLDLSFATVVEQDAEEPYRQAMAQLRRLYQQALERDMAALRPQANKAADMAAIEREIDLLKNGGAISPNNPAYPPLLKQRRQTFLLEAARLEMKRDMLVDGFYDDYAKALTTYTAELSRQGNQEGERSVGALKRALEQGRIMIK
jgi:hypothetical protein